MSTTWWMGFVVGILIVAVVCAIVAKVARNPLEKAGLTR